MKRPELNGSGTIPRNLLALPEARTDTSIALIWDKPEKAEQIAAYLIYVNGERHGECCCTDYTVEGLKSGTEYEFSVRALLKTEEVFSDESGHVMARTKKAARIRDVRDYGARGDGKTLNTESIQAAIDACEEGDTVCIPKGVFLSGAVYLKGNMTLRVEKEGILLGSADTKDYPLMKYRWEGQERMCYSSLVNTKAGSHENITICGSGTIDASGSPLRKKELQEHRGYPGRAVCIRHTYGVYLKDITVRQSPAWCVHLIYCRGVSVNHITVHSKYDVHGNMYEGISNGDGLNPDSCTNVNIFHSMISSEDDCIAIKSGRDTEGREVGIPTENVRVTNCIFKSGFGVAVGSEMAGSVRNVLVQDCEFVDVYSVGSVKAPRGRGGIVENIRYEDIVFRNSSEEHQDCKWFRGAIYIDQFYSHDEFDLHKEEEVGEGTSIIRDITFRNIILDTVAGNAIYLSGLPESPLRRICLENIEAKGKYGCKIYNTKEITLKNVSCISAEDHDFIFHNVERIM